MQKDQAEADHQDGDQGGDQRRQRVINEDDRELDREHADEMHGPDTRAQGDGRLGNGDPPRLHVQPANARG